MTTEEENQFICEKLLGWHKVPPLSPIPGIEFVGWRHGSAREIVNTPSFTTWADAGLILDALSAKNIRWHLTRSVQFGIYIFSLDPIGSPGGQWEEKRDRKAALAIRSAALAYIRSLP
jgi:hypothetical protein